MSLRADHSGHTDQGFVANRIWTRNGIYSKNLRASSRKTARDIPYPAMIPRTLLRQSRAFSSSVTSATRSSLARPQFRPSQLSLAQSSLRPATSRWYSSEPEAKKEGEAAKEGEKTTEDPAKKELEASKKEIIELKVCRHRSAERRTSD